MINKTRSRTFKIPSLLTSPAAAWLSFKESGFNTPLTNNTASRTSMTVSWFKSPANTWYNSTSTQSPTITWIALPDEFEKTDKDVANEPTLNHYMEMYEVRKWA